MRKGRENCKQYFIPMFKQNGSGGEMMASYHVEKTLKRGLCEELCCGALIYRRHWNPSITLLPETLPPSYFFARVNSDCQERVGWIYRAAKTRWFSRGATDIRHRLVGPHYYHYQYHHHYHYHQTRFTHPISNSKSNSHSNSVIQGASKKCPIAILA